ncbi:hypothetical protein D3C87_1570460 [compost metagenome]
MAGQFFEGIGKRIEAEGSLADIGENAVENIPAFLFPDVGGDEVAELVVTRGDVFVGSEVRFAVREITAFQKCGAVGHDP